MRAATLHKESGCCWENGPDVAPEDHGPMPASCPAASWRLSLAGLAVPLTSHHGTLTTFGRRNTWYLKLKWKKNHVLFKLVFKNKCQRIVAENDQLVSLGGGVSLPPPPGSCGLPSGEGLQRNELLRPRKAPFVLE